MLHNASQLQRFIWTPDNYPCKRDVIVLILHEKGMIINISITCTSTVGLAKGTVVRLWVSGSKEHVRVDSWVSGILCTSWEPKSKRIKKFEFECNLC